MDAIAILATIWLLAFVGFLIWFSIKTHGGTDYLPDDLDDDK